MVDDGLSRHLQAVVEVFHDGGRVGSVGGGTGSLTTVGREELGGEGKLGEATVEGNVAGSGGEEGEKGFGQWSGGEVELGSSEPGGEGEGRG